MNPDYDPYLDPIKKHKYDKREKYKDLYAGPLDEDSWDRGDAMNHAINMSQVGRVITQPGLEGALVLSYKTCGRYRSGKFMIQLCDGSIVEGTWDHWSGEGDSEGVSSDGWTVGEIKPSWAEIDEIPF